MVDRQTIIKNIAKALETVDLPKKFGKKHQGKVRDYYILDGQRLIITTDRQSAFDRILGLISYKGQVLTQLSQFWFKNTADIIPNHLLKVPDPNVMVTKNCEVIPVEMVPRGFLSGVTSTSVWTAYERGERVIYGIKFPDGMRKNQRLKKPIITPTTKAELGAHDQRLTREEIIKRKMVPKDLYEEMERVTLKLFQRGTEICAKSGIILVDTKYEFGLYGGKLMLIDEIHTPDSSRFWVKKTYQERFRKGEEPENFDKEFLRLWYAKRGYRGDGKPPKMSKDLVVDLSQRYIAIYEKLTGKKFQQFPYPLERRILNNVL